MDENVSPNSIIELVLKGGPPWGFRIKEKNNSVIISKINCGGRASKNGLKQNDEIIAVNNLEIDKHPLTLDIDRQDDDLQLTKLDFTYQLIKHTINHNLHLKIKRANLGEQSQSCCYPQTDDEDEQKQDGDSKQSICDHVRRRSELHEFTNFNGTCIHQQQTIQNNIQQANGIHRQMNGNLKATNQLHNPFADYCLNKSNNLIEEDLLLSPTGDEFNIQPQQRPVQQNYPQYLANLNGQFNTQLNSIANANQFHHPSLNQINQQTMHPNHPLFSAAQHTNVPNIICTPAPPDQPQQTTATIVQPLQLLIEDPSDLNTTDINIMDNSPCSESTSDLNLKQFSGRPHKDVWSPGSTTTSTGSSSSCDMHSDSTIKLESVNPLLQSSTGDPNLTTILPSNNLSNVNNLSLNNIGEMNMVLGLGRLDLSNIQLQQQQAQTNQFNQLNQQLNQQFNQQLTSNIQQQQNVQLAAQQDANLLVQQQLAQQQIQQQQIQQQLAQQQLQQQTNQTQPQLQPNLSGYFLSNRVTPIANNIRPIVLDHNNNAINLTSLNQFNRANEQILTNEQLTNRIISPSTQSETSTNTQTSKKIGIRVGSPPPEGSQFSKFWTLPRYSFQQPFTQQQMPNLTKYTPHYVLSYNSQLPGHHSVASNRKMVHLNGSCKDAQQFASQILYNKQNRMDVESPQSNSQPDLLATVDGHQSVTPTPNQQFLNYYPVNMQFEKTDLSDSYAKFCYETATHKFYTIPHEASVAQQRGSMLSLIAPPSRTSVSNRTTKRRKQRRKQLKMSKKLNSDKEENSSEEETDEQLDVNDGDDGDDEIDLKLLKDDEESDEEQFHNDEKDLSSTEDADNEENGIEQKEKKEDKTLENVKSNQQSSASKKIATDKQSQTLKDRKDSNLSGSQKMSQQYSSDPNAATNGEKIDENSKTKETGDLEIGEKSKNDKDNKRKKLGGSQFVSSKKSKKSIKKSIKKRPSSKSEQQQKLEQMSANELLKTKLRQVKKKFELINLLNDDKKHTGKIADYLPGRSSVLAREKQKESLSDRDNFEDRRTAMSMGKIEDKTKEHQRRKRQQQLKKLQKHQHSILSKNCAFNVLIASDDTTTTNGYESDSSYIIRRREPIPAPVSRSVYSSVQRGEEIPFEGLRRSMPYMRAKDDKFRKPLSIDSRDNIPTDQLNRFIDKELDWINHETSLLVQRRHHYNMSPQDQILSFNRYKYSAANKSTSELSKSLLAKVLYDFRAVYGRELSVKKGDIVIVIRSVNNNWIEVEDIESGLKGFVPRNFLDYEQEGLAKAKYDFDAKTGVEVSFKKDEILRLIRKVDQNWFEGVNSKNENGIIPINYIEIMRHPLNLHYDNQFLSIICKGQSTTPQSHPYTRSAVSTPQSSYLSSNIRAKQIGSHPNLSIEPIIESDSANSSNHQTTQPPPNSSFFFSRSSSAMCQNKALSQLQASEQFAKKASLAASAPHLIDDIEQPSEITAVDKQQTSTTATNTNQTAVTNQSQTNPPLPHPPLPNQSDFASTTSLATTSNLSQLANIDNYPFRNQQYLPHPRNLSNINNHFNLTKRLPTDHLNNATSNSHLAMKRLYRVLYPYKPRQADELELIAGDIVMVSLHCDDGWFIGFSTLTNQSGTFPGNYVCPLN